MGNGAAIYRPDFFDVPTDFWLSLYWLLLCGMLIYLLVYGSRALLILRRDPRSRRIANIYLLASASGVVACAIRIITAYVPALQTPRGRQPGVVLRLHVRRRFRPGLGTFLADQDEVVPAGVPLTAGAGRIWRIGSPGIPQE